jgi:hypothetical protein
VASGVLHAGPPDSLDHVTTEAKASPLDLSTQLTLELDAAAVTDFRIGLAVPAAARRHEIEARHGGQPATGLKLDFDGTVLLGAFQDVPPEAAPSAGTAKQATDSATPTPLMQAISHGDLAKQATNPAAPLMLLQLQNSFIPESHAADGYANQFIIQPVIPVKKLGWLPRTIWRPTIPIVTTPDLDAGIDGTTGLGDITIVGVAALDYDWGELIVGAAATLPTATDDRLGAGQWQLGPAAGAIFSKLVPNTQLGVFAYQEWGLGGPGDQYTSQLSFQPVLVYHFEDGWYTGLGDDLWTFNWETNGNYIPLSWRVGKVFAIGDQKVNMFVSGFYNVGDDVPGKGAWGFKLSFSLLFPTG